MANKAIHATINLMKFLKFNCKLSANNKKIFFIFLLLSSIFSCDETNQQASFSRMIERGYVTVGTLYGSNSFYIQGSGTQVSEFAGFEYELAKKYAQYLNLELRVVPSYNLDELFIKLNNGDVDFLAAGLSVTDKRLQRFRFAPSYQDVTQKLVFKQGQTGQDN